MKCAAVSRMGKPDGFRRRVARAGVSIRPVTGHDWLARIGTRTGSGTVRGWTMYKRSLAGVAGLLAAAAFALLPGTAAAQHRGGGGHATAGHGGGGSWHGSAGTWHGGN